MKSLSKKIGKIEKEEDITERGTDTQEEVEKRGMGWGVTNS